MTKQLLSFGGGVNSMALLTLAKKGELHIDIAIFADTQAEMPETYIYIDEVVKPLCHDIGIEFFVVKGGRKGLGLYDYCVKQRIIITQIARFCTIDWKIMPIMDWISEKGITNYKCLIGIDYGEKHRAKNIIEKSQHPSLGFPLIDFKINRTKCKRIIKTEGFSVPTKSGCFLCPFKSVKGFRAMVESHPDLIRKNIELEENANKARRERNPKAPQIFIRNPYPMREIFGKSFDNKKQWTLDDEVACVFCHL